MSPAAASPTAPVLELTGASLRVGDRELWRELDLVVAEAEFLAVLGANGSGKTSLLRAILGQRALDRGEVRVAGEPARRGDARIGTIPQQRPLPLGTPLRGRDLVALGADGHRFGLPLRSRETRERVDAALAAVGAAHLASTPVSELSGGEQQRLRVAQALVGDPVLLLCDEPLLSLDLPSQQTVASLIDGRRRQAGTAVLFVTHDVNPVLDMVDRILYLANGRFRIGTPAEVLRSEVLSELYGTRVEVLRAAGRVAVVGVPEADVHHGHGHEHAPEHGGELR
ncbi:metal ABC transporter ATP-binding protein [Homoserinibacter sp. YIM 151385]|uniref:metal ABC transporter ATP-binding protein n=1 Tax=Homoserinibacter sp. YIM 151385 TaxID=2985506 RepID=UPI0022F0E63A|nr:metal ABC transporter ATP-binding protein [Homoserinibacter sp. YIM 151385]WBU37278.1 metal ABC transporter ATP-binding protein [Homoserinibacter sp. YIM 151385]